MRKITSITLNNPPISARACKKILLTTSRSNEKLMSNGPKENTDTSAKESIKSLIQREKQALNEFDNIVSPPLPPVKTQLSNAHNKVASRLEEQSKKISFKNEHILRACEGMEIQPISFTSELPKLKLTDSKSYFIESSAGILIPNGKYNFVITEGYEVHLSVCRTKINHPHYKLFEAFGHQTMAFILKEELIYAGTINFENGTLTRWNNSSGHYKPPQDWHNKVFNSTLNTLLPSEKFKPLLW